MSQPHKILVCAPSNAAVDILTKNLVEARKKYTIDSMNSGDVQATDL